MFPSACKQAQFEVADPNTQWSVNVGWIALQWMVFRLLGYLGPILSTRAASGGKRLSVPPSAATERSSLLKEK